MLASEPMPATEADGTAAEDGAQTALNVGDPPLEASDEAAAATTDEPAFVEIWRPGRRDRQRPERRGPPKSRRARATAPGEPGSPARPNDGSRPPDGRAGKGRPPRKRKFDRPSDKPPTYKAPAEKRADPNSPFAALAALKAQLEGKDDGG